MSVYDLTGRKALVTGGAQGLGAGMAEALARAGAAVVIGDVREELGKATADSLRQSGATAEFVSLDVTDDAGWEQAISRAVSYLGGLDSKAGAVVKVRIVECRPQGAFGCSTQPT